MNARGGRSLALVVSSVRGVAAFLLLTPLGNVHAQRRAELPPMVHVTDVGLARAPGPAEEPATVSPHVGGVTPATTGAGTVVARPADALPRRADLWKLGGMAALAVGVATADRRGDAWARRSGVQESGTLDVLSRLGDAAGSYGAVGVGPAAWLLGRARGDSGTAVLGLRTTEAVVLSGVAVAAIKAIAGRRRPDASADNSPAHWDLFGGVRSDSARSFASGHSALSAAAAVTLAAEWRRQGARGWQTVGPPLVYALASLTAASRVRDRRHWLSDVIAGAAVGTASALIVRRWHDARPGGTIDRTFLAR